jgi:ubiquinone/menaquinone biosynthesis C-methylase UbiE
MDSEVYTRDTLKRIDQAYEDDSIFVARTKLAVKFIRGHRILDVGCGTGNTSLRIVQNNPKTEILAVDLLKSCIEFSKEKFRSYGNVSVAQMEICNLALKDESFDCVVALDVLEHVEHDAEAMLEIFRVMVTSGRLVLTVPAIEILYGERDKALKHFRRYSRQSLSEKLKSIGFRIERIVYWNPIAVLPFMLFEKLLGKPLSCPSKWTLKKKTKRRISYLISSLMMMLVCLEAPIGLSLLIIAVKEKSFPENSMA